MYLIWRAFCMSKFPARAEIFRNHPDRPCGPPSLLYDRYRVTFPGIKRPGRGVDHPQTCSTEVKEKVELYLFSPSGPSWPVLGWPLPLPFPLPLLEQITDGCHSCLYTVLNISLILIYLRVQLNYYQFKFIFSKFTFLIHKAAIIFVLETQRPISESTCHAQNVLPLTALVTAVSFAPASKCPVLNHSIKIHNWPYSPHCLALTPSAPLI